MIAVGANDDNGTRWSSDDVIPSFSSCGTSSRHVDLVAPGKSIEGLRNPGSDADQQHPNAIVDSRKFKGSGTSQAAAVGLTWSGLTWSGLTWSGLTWSSNAWTGLSSGPEKVFSQERSRAQTGIVRLLNEERSTSPFGTSANGARRVPLNCR